MRKTKFLFWLAFILLTNLQVVAQQKIYEPTWESLNTRSYPAWFNDAKLGIFIHWGLYSVPSWSTKEQYAEWFLRGLMTNDTARINFQKRVFGENFTYEQYKDLFKAELFDANQWADLFQKAGAKYIILVSKHHDGYCLWPSKYAPGWNSMETGPKRNIVGELEKAIRKNTDIKFGLYYSLPEWNSPLYRWGTDPGTKVNEYVEKHMVPQFKELISTYKPSLVFTDGEWDHSAATWKAPELISWYFNTVGDEAIVNNRWGGGSDYGFLTPEYSSGIHSPNRPWAECRGMGRSFGLNRNETIDAYLTPEDLIHFFVMAVANGGGMTLNVGPAADGQIPLLQQERLLQLGSWLKVNGEAIYGSRAFTKTIEEKDVTVTRVDSTINFDWVRNSPIKGIKEDDFTAKWEGFITPKYSESYRFEAVADDGIRVWVNNQLVVDQWGNTSTEKEGSVMDRQKGAAKGGQIKLKAGVKYAIKVEYFESKQNAHAFLYWQSKHQSRQIVPQEALATEISATGDGLKAVYSSKKTTLCYTSNKGNIYAIALEWPEDKLVLNIPSPASNAKVTLLGRDGVLPWTYENGKMVIDVTGIRYNEVPCQWAWTFKIAQ
jgi:alpha-L-fucosidase